MAWLWLGLVSAPPTAGGPPEASCHEHYLPETTSRGAWCVLGSGRQAVAFCHRPPAGPLYVVDGAGHKAKLVYHHQPQQIVAEVAALPAGFYAVCTEDGTYLGCLALGPKE